MFAVFLQVVALVGLPVGGFIGNAGIVCTSISVGFVGLAIERGNA